MDFRYDGKSNLAGIYKITNTQNGRFYIGSTKCFRVRWFQHSKSLEKGKHQNRFLQADYLKCGEEAFLFEVLQVIEGDKSSRLKAEEILLGQHFDNGQQCYNLTKRAISKEDSIVSKTPEKTRKKRSESSKKMWEDPEYRARQSEIQSRRTKELWQDPEYRVKHEVAIRNVSQTDEHRQKLSASAKATWSDPDFRAKAKDIYQSQEFKDKVGNHTKALWQNEEYKTKQNKARKDSWAVDTERKRKASELMKTQIAKTYTLRDPDGEIVTFTNMKEFCSKRNLHSSGLCKVANGKWKSYKGWTRTT